MELSKSLHVESTALQEVHYIGEWTGRAIREPLGNFILDLDEDFYFNESEAQDILLPWKGPPLFLTG